MSFAGLLYTSGLTAILAGGEGQPRLGGVKEQTRAILRQIDAILSGAGTDKSRVLWAQVWLTDMDNFADHCDAWNEWVDVASPPVRACLLSARLWRPELLVEIMVTAALP